MKISWTRRFCPAGTDPLNSVEWERREVTINSPDGKPVFHQSDVEAPVSWSQTAVNIAASKYFRGALGTPERESSVKQLIERVAHAIKGFVIRGEYMDSLESVEAWCDDLKWLLVNQYGAFNSPVWFNAGIDEHPQCSACFILGIEDSLESIMDLAKTESMIFKGGSGSGVNLSALRSSKERLNKSNGFSSGPVSFMKGLDAFAGVIKSGGRTRRAAKMVILNIDHPDIEEFINCKIREENKAKALVAAGYSASLDGEAYATVAFQNANNSVRVTDDFMRAVEEDKDWDLKAVTTGEVLETLKARDLLYEIAQATWECGDPGMQFDTISNEMNTVPKTGRVNSSNPCSEFFHLDNTSCNLASLNLLKFSSTDDGAFDMQKFCDAIMTFIVAMEAIVSYAKYPTQAITENSHKLRPLGLGYANLGALLMSRGYGYDSDEGRQLAANITSLMTAAGYWTSARLAQAVGPFAEFEKNREDMLVVLKKHQQATEVSTSHFSAFTWALWEETLRLGREHGYRNAQISLLAPCGTIGFMMDCDTTGIEPELALVRYKFLVGGGFMRLVNNTVPEALKKLGYNETSIESVVKHIVDFDTIEGSELKEEHLAVFDCAFKPANGTRSLKPEAHLKMMAAVQPFLSGAISKTVNMPNSATVQDIYDTYLSAWRSGLKAVAIYRDGCKGQQPVKTSKS